MTAARPRPTFVLAVHPSSYGLGWVLFEGPFSPYDWGHFRPRREKNATCLRRLERMLDRHTPETIVLETFDPGRPKRSDRVVRLCRSIVALAGARGLEVAIYSKGDVQACFASVGARTRQEIAEAVVRHVDAFRHLLPKKRRAWENEHQQMDLFTATSLILSHYQLDSSEVLRRMRL